MNQLPGTLVPRIETPLHKKIGDLQYFDGPLLSEFINREGDTFLAHWCDCSESTNRWLVFPIRVRDVLRLKNISLSLREAIDKSAYVYFIDINSAGDETQKSISSPSEIPDAYLPALDAKIDLALSPTTHAQSYSVLIDGEWSIDNSRVILRAFETAYYLIYAAQKPKQAVKDLGAYPWKGGFSAMHFYKGLEQYVPADRRPMIQAIQYQSPGYMTFQADPAIGCLVAEAVKNFHQSESILTAHYKTLAAYISKDKLNEVTPYDTKTHDEVLASLSETIINEIRGGITWAWVSEHTGSRFESAKIVMSYFRRIKDLAQAEAGGLIKLLAFPHN
jgi:hypothetical protein